MREAVQWEDALIAWSLLYLKLSKINIRDHGEVREALEAVLAGTDVRITYSRWSADSRSYRRFDPGRMIVDRHHTVAL